MDTMAMMYVYPNGSIGWTAAFSWKGRVHGLFLPIKGEKEQIWVDHFPELGSLNNDISTKLPEFLGRNRYLQIADLSGVYFSHVKGFNHEDQYTFTRDLIIESNPFINRLRQTTDFMEPVASNNQSQITLTPRRLIMAA